MRSATVASTIASVTDDAEEFLRGDYDVVVEALGGTEPAVRYVAHFLRRGIPVVSANKALLAERGPELAKLGAKVEVVPVDGLWKIRSIEILDEQRVQ